jgi:hypothetical protein
MKSQDILGNLDKISCHVRGLSSCCLAFESSNIFAPYVMCRHDIFCSDGAVLNLVGSYDPLEILD